MSCSWKQSWWAFLVVNITLHASLWSQKLWEALTHRGPPGCLPTWPSLSLATTPHYKSREQTEGYWVGQRVVSGVGCCSINSVDLPKIKFERQIDLLDLVDRWCWAGIIRWENYLKKKNCKLDYKRHVLGINVHVGFFSVFTCKHAVSLGSVLLDILMQNIADASSITHHSSP